MVFIIVNGELRRFNGFYLVDHTFFRNITLANTSSLFYDWKKNVIIKGVTVVTVR